MFKTKPANLLAHQSMLLDERPHLGEPQVVPGYRGAGLLDAAHVEIAAAARVGDGALAGVGSAEARVAVQKVGVYGPVGDLRVADGTTDRFWEQMDTTGRDPGPVRLAPDGAPGQAPHVGTCPTTRPAPSASPTSSPRTARTPVLPSTPPRPARRPPPSRLPPRRHPRQP